MTVGGQVKVTLVRTKTKSPESLAKMNIAGLKPSHPNTRVLWEASCYLPVAVISKHILKNHLTMFGSGGQYPASAAELRSPPEATGYRG